MDDYRLLLLLHLIQRDGSLQSLLNHGEDFTSIYLEIKNLKQNGLVSDLKGSLDITSMGIEKIEKLNNKLQFQGLAKWLVPNLEYKIPQYNKFDIYLPKE